MATIFPIPLYRFFSEEKYADAMVNNGEIFFNKISAFTTLEDLNFRDETETTHLFKLVQESTHQFGGSLSITKRHRKISDAWAFCATTSSASTAKKKYCVWVKDVNYFLNEIDIAVRNKFGQELPILFGPVTYNSKKADACSKVQHPPYFTKPEANLTDLEFRIVIPPPREINDCDIQPMTLIIPNPSYVFEKTLIFTTDDGKLL